MGLAVGQPVRKKEIEVRWRAEAPPPHPRMDTIPRHVEQPESSIKQTQEQLHNPITIQGNTLESCGEEFYAENFPAGA